LNDVRPVDAAPWAAFALAWGADEQAIAFRAVRLQALVAGSDAGCVAHWRSAYLPIQLACLLLVVVVYVVAVACCLCRCCVARLVFPLYDVCRLFVQTENGEDGYVCKSKSCSNGLMAVILELEVMI
jgi:hypothetical protein